MLRVPAPPGHGAARLPQHGPLAAPGCKRRTRKQPGGGGRQPRGPPPAVPPLPAGRPHLRPRAHGTEWRWQSSPSAGKPAQGREPPRDPPAPSTGCCRAPRDAHRERAEARPEAGSSWGSAGWDLEGTHPELLPAFLEFLGTELGSGESTGSTTGGALKSSVQRFRFRSSGKEAERFAWGLCPSGEELSRAPPKPVVRSCSPRAQAAPAPAGGEAEI